MERIYGCPLLLMLRSKHPSPEKEPNRYACSRLLPRYVHVIHFADCVRVCPYVVGKVISLPGNTYRLFDEYLQCVYVVFVYAPPRADRVLVIRNGFTKRERSKLARYIHK
jgi:hypothetical protein